ncbi:MAG: hypothetical protein ACKN89_07050 [Cyanobium sp.]|jgi:hypothetical protein|nr:hypothetical protein [Synechococcaceae cyanobacterium]
MASSSISFRISRSAEDLATTIHAVSQRLVLLEQRLDALELQLNSQASSDPEQMTRLENVDRLLHDCRSLLELDAEPAHLRGQRRTPAASLAQEPAPVDGATLTIAPVDQRGEEPLAA